MKRSARAAGVGLRLVLLCVASGAMPAPSAHGDEGRFNVASFLPFGAPQDLVMVGQSRPISHLSFSVGGYLAFSVDALTVVNTLTGSHYSSLVHNRLQMDVMAAFGLYDWVEFGVAVPTVLWQDSDNLQVIGTEGSVQPTALGDIRLTSKVALLRRKAEGTGLGIAATLGVSLPSGNVNAFLGDGAVDFMGGLILDYRFPYAILLAVNAGVWVRPDREFVGLKLGAQVPLGVAMEVPIIRRWGMTLIGEGVANVSIDKFPDQPRQIPAEVIFGFRWYGSSGLTWTIAGGVGCACAFAAPTLSLMTTLVWVPGKTREYEALERFKVPPGPEIDPDRDHVIGETDRCPDKAGPVENHGCPDDDRDGDGVVDRLDKCPDDFARTGSKDGCPQARIKGKKIVILEQVHFATDQDIILPESFPILEEVAKLLDVHSEVQQLLVEGHTDIRASAGYNIDLSNRRAGSVMRFLTEHGVDKERLNAKGFGRERPLVPNDTEAGMAVNRRVEFTIEKTGIPKPPPVVEVQGISAPAVLRLPGPSVLPTLKSNSSQLLPSPPKPEPTLLKKESSLPANWKDGGQLGVRGDSLLPSNKSTLPTKNSSLPPAKKSTLPTNQSTLP